MNTFVLGMATALIIAIIILYVTSEKSDNGAFGMFLFALVFFLGFWIGKSI